MAVINIAITNSHALPRWTEVLGLLHEKNAGTPHIHRFRTLHLVESDLNFVMRLVWGRELMTWAEANQAINDNQYGGRRGVQDQSAALNKTLSLDIIRYQAEPATIVDNDAQACYDRILVTLLGYALLRLGMPIHLIRFQCNWLTKAHYRLRLHDRLTDPYSSNETHVLQGTGQGTG